MRHALPIAIVLALLLPASAVAGTASVDPVASPGRTLTYTAAPGEANRIVVTRDLASPYPYEYVVQDAAVAVVAGPGCRAVDEHTARCAGPLIGRPSFESGSVAIVVDAGDGNDVVTVPPTSDPLSIVRGGDGQDVLTGAGYLNGGAGNDILTGGDNSPGCSKGCGPSPDGLVGGAGDDLLRGGNGDDDLLAGGDGDALDGGAGDDRLAPRQSRSLRCGAGNDVVARPRGARLDDCETVQIGARRFPTYTDTLLVAAVPRRGRDGTLRFPWSCNGTAGRCDLTVGVRRGNARVERRSQVILVRGDEGVVVIRPRRGLRRGQLVTISISGNVYSSGPPGGKTIGFTSVWRLRL